MPLSVRHTELTVIRSSITRKRYLSKVIVVGAMAILIGFHMLDLIGKWEEKQLNRDFSVGLQ